MLPHSVNWSGHLSGLFQEEICPSALLFFVAGLVLLVVCVQFSVEISTLEEETRTLAEEIALLALTVEQLQADEARKKRDDASAEESHGQP